jgi:3-hydroxy acid dehydrogenase/malonic semialdehyde reductase
MLFHLIAQSEVVMTSLRDKFVFITGASSGIGRACAKAFAREGARILMAARRGDRLAGLAAEIKKESGVPVHHFVLDVRHQPEVAAAVAGLPAEWADIDVLVNNAGLSRGLDKLHEGLLSDW